MFQVCVRAHTHTYPHPILALLAPGLCHWEVQLSSQTQGDTSFLLHPSRFTFFYWAWGRSKELILGYVLRKFPELYETDFQMAMRLEKEANYIKNYIKFIKETYRQKQHLG